MNLLILIKKDSQQNKAKNLNESKWQKKFDEKIIMVNANLSEAQLQYLYHYYTLVYYFFFLTK